MLEDNKTENTNSILAENEFEIPPECCVVFYNDDHTTIQFVIEVLEQYFNKSHTEALFLIDKIQSKGSAIVGIYTYDIAITRATLTTNKAKKAGLPLKVEVRK